MATVDESPGIDAVREHGLAELGTVASRVVHEIRNPLNAIRMQAAVIRRMLANPDAANLAVANTQLELLEKEVLRIEHLAQAFLEFGKPPPDEPEAIDVAALVEETAALARADFQQTGLSVSVTVPSECSLRVFMDRDKLQQVLHNLIKNAKTAMSEGGQLSMDVLERSDEHLAIRVCDTGQGIPEDMLRHVFEPFYSGTGGSGLGLPIVKRLIESVGGWIQIESEPGVGTRIDVVLPRCD